MSRSTSTQPSIVGTRFAVEIFKTPAAGLEGLRAQARTFLTEHELARRSANEDECELDLSRLGAVLAEGITRLAE